MTSTHVVESAEVASVLASGRGTSYLGPYFDRPTSIAEAARELSRPLSRVHYWTHRWHDLGILVVHDVAARKGRPIRRYRTVADVIEVPPELLPHTLFESQMARDTRELVAALGAAVPEVVHGGLLRIHKPAGLRGVNVDRTLGDVTRMPSDALQSSFGLTLDKHQAEQLRLELEELRTRWLRKSGRSGRSSHLVALALAPVPRS